MTSSIPTANKKIRELEWVKDTKRTPVIFYKNDGDNKGLLHSNDRDSCKSSQS